MDCRKLPSRCYRRCRPNNLTMTFGAILVVACCLMAHVDGFAPSPSSHWNEVRQPRTVGRTPIPWEVPSHQRKRPPSNNKYGYDSFGNVKDITAHGWQQRGGSSIGGTSTALKAHPSLLAARFIANWKSYSIIPLVAGFVGWITNYLAVQMIFYPIKWRGIPLLPPIEGQPLGFLGWQGIVPAKTVKMTEAMVNATITQLLSMEEAVQRLEPSIVADILLVQAPSILKMVCQDLTVNMPERIRNWVNSVVVDSKNGPRQQSRSRRFLANLINDVQNDVNGVLNLRNCVVNQMIADRSLLGKLFQISGKKELAFLVDSGLYFGFILGLIQLLVALFWDNPWTLSIGGLIVGLATNWLALKWIFEPVNPTKVGPFVLQGLFLRRQKEVSADFSNFFATNILTSEKLWNSILLDPSTSPKFAEYFAKDLSAVAAEETAGLVDLQKQQPRRLRAAAQKATKKLPAYLSDLHGYVDDALDIERTLRVRMTAMSAEQFERVLHPIFEEDELTLILAGGGLGFVAGFIQQQVATGALKWSNLLLPTPLGRKYWVSAILSMLMFGGGYVFYFFLFGMGSFKRRLLNRLQDPATVFDALDADGNGYLEPLQFIQASKNLGLRLSDEKLGRIFTSLDQNNAGRIVKTDFEDWLNQNAGTEIQNDLKAKVQQLSLKTIYLYNSASHMTPANWMSPDKRGGGGLL